VSGWNSYSSEFAFELRVCRWAELSWPPSGDTERPHIVARQLGTKHRRWDTIVIECDPKGLRTRSQFGDKALDRDLLHVVTNAPASWQWYRNALPKPSYDWRYVRESVHRAADRGILNIRKRGNKIEIKRIAPYPQWVRRIVAIENKPDLTAAAADSLAEQIEHDVTARLADEVWVATAETKDHISPALLEQFPVEAGIITLSFETGVTPTSGSVRWHPTSLRSNEPEDSVGGRVDRRLVLAERAYGRGWRSYHRTMRPDCRQFQLQRDGRSLLPFCAAKKKLPTVRECAGSCGSFEPEPPQWRMQGWPIEGGPGKGIVDLLAQRRKRERAIAMITQ